MAKWQQRLRRPAGALPGNIVTKVGVGVTTVLVLGLVLTQGGGGGRDDGAADGQATTASVGMLSSFAGRLRQQVEEGRTAGERAVAAAALEAAAAELTGAPEVASGTVGVGDGVWMPGGVPGLARSAAEEELLDELRLEALERAERSLRSSGVVQLRARGPAAAGTGAAGPGGSAGPTVPPVRPAAPPEQGGVAGGAPDVAGLVEQITAAQRAVLGGGLLGAAAATRARTVPGVTGPAVAEASGDPPRVVEPDDPAGWERVYEGSVISGVLITQLSGEFAGPALAEVSVPLYSEDRQRILIPRGARFVGAAQAVEIQDQSRLAVGFHRLMWPDGRWVDLGFHGMSGVGESALGDQVDRHYLAMFGAAGAVGVLAGLTLQGATPYGGGIEGFRAGAGQGFGQAATQILQRFLNRLPTVTIRAGHRVRIWVTGDFLVPRPATAERMYR